MSQRREQHSGCSKPLDNDNFVYKKQCLSVTHEIKNIHWRYTHCQWYQNIDDIHTWERLLVAAAFDALWDISDRLTKLAEQIGL